MRTATRIGVFLVCVSFVGMPARAATYYVRTDGNNAWNGLAPEWDGLNGPKASVNAGLTAASVASWNTLDIGSGTFNMTGLNLTQPIIIQGAGSGQTILQQTTSGNYCLTLNAASSGLSETQRTTIRGVTMDANDGGLKYGFNISASLSHFLFDDMFLRNAGSVTFRSHNSTARDFYWKDSGLLDCGLPASSRFWTLASGATQTNIDWTFDGGEWSNCIASSTAWWNSTRRWFWEDTVITNGFTMSDNRLHGFFQTIRGEFTVDGANFLDNETSGLYLLRVDPDAVVSVTNSTFGSTGTGAFNPGSGINIRTVEAGYDMPNEPVLFLHNTFVRTGTHGFTGAAGSGSTAAWQYLAADGVNFFSNVSTPYSGFLFHTPEPGSFALALLGLAALLGRRRRR